VIAEAFVNLTPSRCAEHLDKQQTAALLDIPILAKAYLAQATSLADVKRQLVWVVAERDELARLIEIMDQDESVRLNAAEAEVVRFRSAGQALVKDMREARGWFAAVSVKVQQWETQLERLLAAREP
jgi:hypothetical protein